MINITIYIQQNDQKPGFHTNCLVPKEYEESSLKQQFSDIERLRSN